MKKSKAVKKAVKKTTKRAAVAAAPVPELKVAAGATGMKQAIDIMCDKGASVPLRKEALRALQSASFGHPDFESVRGDYITGLRGVAEDAEPELRQVALETLSQEQDPYAEKKLADGLRDEKKALVPPEDALHYLSYNVHAGVQSLARNVFKESKDDKVRQQALRVMSSDPEATKMIEKTLNDKNESSTLRQTSAAALNALDPKALQKWAHKAAMDKNEKKEMVSTCLTALNQFGDKAAIAKDTALRKRIGQMSKKATPQVKQLARSVSQKYGL
jgi:HEAT repeat protein